MKTYSGLQGVLGLCCVLLSFGAWAQDEGGGEASEEEAADGGFGSQASANANDRRLYMSPMLSYTQADKDRMTDDALGGVMSIGKKMTSGLNLELTGFVQQMDREDTTVTDASAELSGVGLAAMIFPSANYPNLFGILAVHQAQGNDHPTTPDVAGFNYKSTVFDTGIGYLLPLNQLLGFEAALRAEVRYRMDSHHRSALGVGGKEEFYEGVANIGLLIPLGKLPGEPAPPVEEPAPVGDADGDGVLDDADQCPDTPAGSTVNASGCENDADGDGVVDRLDQCPDTPAGTTVDEKGCPPAPVEREGCRAPGPGEAINLEGCATGEAVVLKGVNFEVNSSRLTANAKVILNQVADSLAAAPHLRVEIGGHTDAQGSDAFNLKLSDRRAQAVKDYLLSRGIDASRLESKGYGEAQPVDTNETADGRELNRRVEMKVLEGGTQ